MLNWKEIKLMQLAIQEMCVHFDFSNIFNWDIDTVRVMKDDMFDFVWRASDSNSDNIKLCYIYILDGMSYDFDDGRENCFKVVVRDSVSQSELFWLTGFFKHNSIIKGSARRDNRRIKSYCFSIKDELLLVK